MKTTLTPKTHIGRIRLQNATQLQRVCELLKWTHEDYCRHQYEEYEEFVKRACIDIPESANKLRYSSVFRGFYNQQWTFRNIGFIAYATEAIEPALYLTLEGVFCDEGVSPGHFKIIDEYKFLHCAKGLFYDGDFRTKYANVIDIILNENADAEH